MFQACDYTCGLCGKPILEGEMYHTLLRQHSECLRKQEQEWAAARAKGAAAIQRLETLLRKKP